MADGLFELNFSPNPYQKAFIESEAKADLFSSRMGEGKSAGIVWCPFYHTRHNPGAKWIIIRDTMENLRSTTMQEFFKWFPPGVCGSFHQTHRLFTWAEGLAQGTVEFIGLDDPNDAGKLQSRDIGGFAIDEAAPSANSGGISELIFDIAMSRLRQRDMRWYAAKLAENNPDESHWTFRRFVQPGTEGFKIWQPISPENVSNLPAGYYSELRRIWGHRPDLIRRFIDGKFGFQQVGQAVTPEWSDDVHLALGLTPQKGRPLHMLWDFGLNPTCIITQVTSAGTWQILDSMVGESVGVEELCEMSVRPLVAQKYRGFKWDHIGDPSGKNREPSSSRVSAVRMLTKQLGGTWQSGPIKFFERREPLRAILAKQHGGRGLIQVDRQNATEVWHALRGGWHFHVSRAGITSLEPDKNIHSHPGDAMGYGAARLYPLVKLQGGRGFTVPAPASAWTSPGAGRSLGFEQPGRNLPPEARQIKGR